MKAKIALQILVKRDDVPLNYKVHHKEAMQFVEWLQSRETQVIILDFGKDKYGENLFFPNSQEGKIL